MKESTINKRNKKAQNRLAKEQKKASNAKKPDNKRPNNLILGILIFGIIIGLFAVGAGIKYFQKEKTIESFIKANPDTYKNMQLDEATTINITAKKNRLNAKMTITTDDKDVIKEIKDYYTGEDAQKNTKYFGAYYLSSIKPSTRAIFADADVHIVLNDKEIQKTHLTCFDADRIMSGTYYQDLEKDKDKDTDKSKEDEHNHDEEPAAEAESEVIEQ